MVAKGMAAMAAAKNKMGSGGGSSNNVLTLKVGQTVIGRFFGDFENDEAPIVVLRHYIKGLSGADAYQVCAFSLDENGTEVLAEGHEGCAVCYASSSLGKKNISRSPNAVFFVKDYSRYHSLDQEVRFLKPGVFVQPGKPAPATAYEQSKYPPCSAPRKPCQFCKEGKESKERGYKPFPLALQFAQQITGQIPELSQHCRCGAKTEDGSPSLTVQGYWCPECNNMLDDYFPESGSHTQCPNCSTTVVPNELLQCCGCENPERAKLQDYKFQMTKTGEKKSTNYTFTPIYPPNPPTEEELELAAKYTPDWSKASVSSPKSADEQSRLLSIPNPFTGVVPQQNRGAGSYGNPPKPAPRPGAPLGKPAPAGFRATPPPTFSARPSPGGRPPVMRRPAEPEYEEGGGEEEIPYLGSQ